MDSPKTHPKAVRNTIMAVAGIFIIISGVLAVLFVCKPTDFAIRAEVRKQLNLVADKQGNKNLVTAIAGKDLTEMAVENAITQILEIRDIGIAKLVTLHGKDRDQFGLGFRNEINFDKVDWQEIANSFDQTSEIKTPDAQISQNKSKVPEQQDNSAIDSAKRPAIDYLPNPKPSYKIDISYIDGNWLGTQPPYTAKDQNGNNLIVNGDDVLIPGFIWDIQILPGSNDVVVHQQGVENNNVETNSRAVYHGKWILQNRTEDEFQILCDVKSEDGSSNLQFILLINAKERIGLWQFSDNQNGPSFQVGRGS